MDRNGFSAVFLLLLFALSSFSDASLLNNLRTFVVKRDSLPSSPVTEQGQVSPEKKPNSSGDTDTSAKKLDKNAVIESSKEKSADHVEGSGDDEKKKLPSEDLDPVKKGSEEKKLDFKTDKEPKKEEVSQPKLPEEMSKEKEKQQPEQEQKPGSESVNDPSQQKKLDPGEAKEEAKQQSAPPPPPKDVTVTKSSEAGTVPPPPPSEKTQKKKEDKVEKKEDKSGSGTITDETCGGLNPSCTVQDLVGCIKSSDGSRVVVLVQNKGENILKANVAEGSSGQGIETEIPKRKSKLIPISLSNGKSSNIVINKKCELPLPLPGDEDNSFLRFPTYDKLMNPINGAYLVILTAIIFGATFACIKFSRRKRQAGGGIPYQELEMGLPSSVSAEIETAEGWDQGWDDDWDNHIKSPSARRISGNGLTARSPVKDGWDDSWDD